MKGQLAETLRRPAVIFTFWTLLLLFFAYLGLVIRYRLKRRAYQRRLAAAKQIRLDLEDEEDELRYERRVRTSAPARQELVMEPESYRKKQEAAVDEPTRVTGETVPVREPEIAEEPADTAEPELPAAETEAEPPSEPTKVVTETDPLDDPTRLVPEADPEEDPTRVLNTAEPPSDPTKVVEVRNPMEEPTRVSERIDPRETSRAIPQIDPEDGGKEPGSGPRDYYSEFFENNDD
jgi:cbb3-type cytochrome oxidase subunit 3